MDLGELLATAPTLGEMETAGDDLVAKQAMAELEWLEKRRGKITGSNFGLLMKKPNVTKAEIFTGTCQTYLRGIIAERLGSTIPSPSARALSLG